MGSDYINASFIDVGLKDSMNNSPCVREGEGRRKLASFMFLGRELYKEVVACSLLW
jgi:hypothetical protein